MRSRAYFIKEGGMIMLEVLKILPAPEIFDRAYMIMVPAKKISPTAVAPHFFDNLKEAQEFVNKYKEDKK